jgi:hypothetical protein
MNGRSYVDGQALSIEPWLEMELGKGILMNVHPEGHLGRFHACVS